MHHRITPGANSAPTPIHAIRFEQPAYPSLPREPGPRAQFAALLREHPNQWALLGAHRTDAAAKYDAYDIRHAQHSWNAAFADGRFEAQTRTIFGEPRVYVRFIGTDDPAPKEEA